MSLKALGKFWNKIDEDSAFKDEFFKSVPKDMKSGAPIVAFAKGKGFEFTEQELREAAAAASKPELSDTQLEAVAGGGEVSIKWRGESQRYLDSFAKLPFNKGNIGGLQR